MPNANLSPPESRVTPWEVRGEVDYDRLVRDFAAQYLSENLYRRFPSPPHVLLRRKFFYAHRDLEMFFSSYERGQPVSIVTGRGPSGRMHIGHIIVFYFAKWLQQRTGAVLHIPLSDDEKYFVRDRSMKEIHQYTMDNIADILAVGFDPERTRIIVDTLDGDVVYPLAALYSKSVNYSTVKAVYGTSFTNLGWIFYPSVQTAHLLLPQVLLGSHETLVPIAIDQDPHVRLSRDIAGLSRFRVKKPVSVMSKFLPTLEDPRGKMSTTDPNKVIWLDDDYPRIKQKLMRFAFSGAHTSLEMHRKIGADLEKDVAYLLLFYLFEDDDSKIAQIGEGYRAGKLTTGEVKEYAAKKIDEFLQQHRERKRQLAEDVNNILDRFRLTGDERERVLKYVYDTE